MAGDRGDTLRVAALVLASALAGCGGGGGHGGAFFGSTGSTGASVAVPATASRAAAPAPAPLVVRILSPAPNAQLSVNTPVVLEGLAVATSASLTWTSTIDGVIGQGAKVTVAKLTPGVHRIGLAATGPGGARGDASVLVVVGGAGGLSGQQLLDFLKTFPQKLLGNPIKFPPSVQAMIDANPCDVNGVSGNGGLSCGFAETGTLTVMRWPNPSFHDQVDFLSEPGRAPGFGGLDNMGAFAGLRVVAGGAPLTTWLRDATWAHRQKYLNDDSAILVTEHESASLGLKVRCEQLVLPVDDVLVQTFQVERLAGSPCAAQVELVYYENLSPCTTKLPYVPWLDVYFDVLNDFAAAYHTGDDAIVHFKPTRADYGALLAFAGAPHGRQDVDRFVDTAHATFGPGAYFAIGGDAPSSGFQVGLDASGLAPPSPANAPDLDAYAQACRGPLGKNPFAAVRANAALSFTLDLAGGPVTRAVYLAAGDRPDGPTGCKERLRRARSVPATAHKAACEQDWHAWLARARLPKPPADARTIAVAKRSLIVARTSADRQGGAIVASIASQLPYACDWPRDGAFMNEALDAAGYPEMVEKHNDFYARVQRSSGLFAGTFDMNYYADGVPGGPVPLEIDEAAFGVWTMANHAKYMNDPVKRQAYLARVYPAIRRGAEFLAGWRDPLTGLQLPANEDDNPMLTRGLHGAAPIHLALESAFAAGQATGESPAVLQRWDSRRQELANAIDRHYWDPGRGAWFDPGGSGNPIGPPIQPTAWAVWPVQLAPFSDPRMVTTCDWLHGQLQTVVRKQVKESAYDAKTTLALAIAWRNDPARRAALRDTFKMLTHELPTEGTLHLGEFYRLDANKRWKNVNDVPHVWEHLLVYHTAIELYP